MNDWIEYRDDKVIIHLGELFRLLLHKLWFILLLTILCGGVLFGYSRFMMTPKYQSSIKMYVNNTIDNTAAKAITSSDILASKDLVETYSVILKSYPTLSRVIKAADLSCTYEELERMISTEAVNETEVFKVTVTSASAEEAVKIANAIAKIAPDSITDIVVGSSVSIVEKARPADHPSSPNVKKLTALGLAMGFLLACAVIIIHSLLRSSSSLEERIRREFDIPVLSAIPEAGKREKNAQIGNAMNFEAAEAYKLLRTNLTFCLPAAERCKVIGVTSSVKCEGKTTTSINLGYTLAQAGCNVWILDCDMRTEGMSHSLQINQSPGLSDLLSGQAKREAVVQEYTLGDVTLHIITAGNIPPNPSELIGSKEMKETIDSISETADYIILDLPPVGVVSDPLNAAGIVDGMMFVVRENLYSRKLYSESIDMLRHVQTKILGTVVTHSTTLKKEHNRYGLQYGYKNGRQFGYSRGSERK